MPLKDRACEACTKDSPAVAASEYPALLAELPGWQVVESNGVPQLCKTFKVANFLAALDLANAIAELAEAEDHHPKLVVEWGRLEVSWWTHTISALHMNDFVLAARCESLSAT